MPMINIAVYEGDVERAKRLKRLLEGTGKYKLIISNSARKLVEQMDGSRDVDLLISNTRVKKDEEDGLKLVRALYLRYQNFQHPMPPVIICSADQRGNVVQLYAYRFSDLPLIFYVFIRNEELAEGGEKLLDVVEKSLEKRRELEESIPEKRTAVIRKRLNNLLKKTITLPQLPSVAVQVQQALRDPEVTFKKLAQIIHSDVTLTANVIKLANSPQFGVSGKISTVEDACKQVGMNAIANTIVAAKVFDAMESLPVDFDLRALRRHSYATATISRIVARRCHAIKSVAARIQFSGAMFAAGLLHDIGKVLMVEYFADDIQTVVDTAVDKQLLMVDAEQEVIGVDHADAGLYAGIEWKFPVLLVNIIGRHHWPLDKILPRLKSRQGRLSQRVIRIADAASYEMGFGLTRSDHQPPKLKPELFQKTGLEKKEFDQWTKEIKDDITYSFEVLGKT